MKFPVETLKTDDSEIKFDFKRLINPIARTSLNRSYLRTCMRLKIYYINLDRSPDRKQFMEKQLSILGVPYERIPAVDGRNLDWNNLESFAVKSRIQEFSNLLTPNMVGASLSHYKAYQRIFEEEPDWALILEDDVEFKADFKEVISNIHTANINKQDVYLLYFHGSEKLFSSEGSVPVSRAYKFYPAVSVWGDYSAGGYLLSKEVAEKMMHHVFPVHNTPDSWGTFHRDKVIGGLWALLPMVTRSANFGSDIGYHKWNKILRKLEKNPYLPIKEVFSFLRRKLNKGTSRYKVVSLLPEWL